MTILDLYTRQCLDIAVGRGLTGHDVAATLERLRFDRGLPQRIYCDNGTEFVSAAMDLWAYTNGVDLDFSRRGKPTDNAAIESFNGRFQGAPFFISETGALSGYRKDPSLMNKLCAFISADARQAYRMSGAGLLLFLLAAGALLVLPGIPHQDMYGHDIALFLDGGWRVLQGQRPHADFTSHLGPVSPLVVAFGMKIAGPTADAVTYGVCAFFLVATCWAWLIARQRAAALTALLFSLFVGATVIATNTMGYEYDQTSYGGLYNRFGHALLSIVFGEVFLPTPSGTPAARGGSSVAAWTFARIGAIVTRPLLATIFTSHATSSRYRRGLAGVSFGY